MDGIPWEAVALALIALAFALAYASYRWCPRCRSFGMVNHGFTESAEEVERAGRRFRNHRMQCRRCGYRLESRITWERWP